MNSIPHPVHTRICIDGDVGLCPNGKVEFLDAVTGQQVFMCWAMIQLRVDEPPMIFFKETTNGFIYNSALVGKAELDIERIEKPTTQAPKPQQIRLGDLACGKLLLHDGHIWVKLATSTDMVSLSDLALIDGESRGGMKPGLQHRLHNDTLVEPVIGDFYTNECFVGKSLIIHPSVIQ